MLDMKISSDYGLVCGNVVIFPKQLAKYISGIDIVDGLLTFDSVRFFNGHNEKYIVDNKGVRHNIDDLVGF